MILTDTDPMPFGKHKGIEMANVPAGYLLWLHKKNRGSKPFGREAQAVQMYILDNLDTLKKEDAEYRAWKDCDATEIDLY